MINQASGSDYSQDQGLEDEMEQGQGALTFFTIAFPSQGHQYPFPIQVKSIIFKKLKKANSYNKCITCN
jgi:hypothetical protein